MEAFAQPSRPASSRRSPHHPSPIASRQLPHGQCYYQDISAGRNAVQCGCRQFWLNDAAQQAGAQHLGLSFPAGNWCFCGHHACYHEAELRAAAVYTRGQGSAIAATPSRQVRAASPSQQPSPHQPACPWGTSSSSRPTSQAQDRNTFPNASGLGLFTNSNRLCFSGASNIGQLHPNNELQNNLPPTQCSAARGSRPPSAVGDRPRSSPAAAYHAPAISQRYPGFDPMQAPAYANNDEQSATEMATPSLAGTPALRDTDEAFANLGTTLEAFNRQHPASRLDVGKEPTEVLVPTNHSTEDRAPTEEERTGSHDTSASLLRQVQALRGILSCTPNLSTSLSNLNARLEALEAQSFPHAPAEELHDRFEHFDGRMLDVEGKVSELEKQTAAVVNGRHGLDGAANASFVSNASWNSGADPGTGHMARLDAISEQILTHHQRISELEAIAPPSVAHPWDIEIVLLPFGSELKGLWSPLRAAATAFATQTNDSNTTPGRSQSSSSMLDDGVMDWKPSSLDTFVPRACGPSRGTAGRIFERLKSRGFVQNITLHGNSANHVAARIMSTFRERLTRQPNADKGALLGLQGPFVPLRKVHKCSALRFLNAAELASPTLWTADFLYASVFMHAPSSSLRRLYITEPVSYLQPSDVSTSWTWSKLRELPRVKLGSPTIVNEADALEPCWAFDERLDPSPTDNASLSSGLSFHSSFDSHILSPRQTNPPSQERQSSDESESERSESVSFNFENDAASDRQLPTSATSLSHAQAAAAPRHVLRSSSFPSHIGVSNIDTSMSKRQMASVSADQTSPLKSLPKRRRVSRSPEDVELMGLWSPRRSLEPTSPRSNRLSRRASASRAASSKRASTSDLGLGGGGAQLAYATPYSHEIGVLRGQDGGLDDETPYFPSDEGGDSDDSEMADEGAVAGNDQGSADDADADMDSDYDEAGAADSEPEDDDARVMRKETRALVRGGLMDSDLSEDDDGQDNDWNGMDEGSDADGEEEDDNDNFKDLDMGPEAQAGHIQPCDQQGDTEEEDELA